MNTQEIERLYIDAAADFRELLNVGSEVMGQLPGVNIFYLAGEGWWFYFLDREIRAWLPTQLAVAATTESWRERLEREHNIHIEPIGREVPFGYPVANTGPSDGWLMAGWQITRLGKSATWLYDGAWRSFDGLAAKFVGLFESLPEAIVAAVKALAAEKREKQEKAKRAMFTTGLPAGLVEEPPLPRKSVVKINHRIDKLAGRTERQGRTVADLVATNEALLERIEVLEGRADNMSGFILAKDLPVSTQEAIRAARERGIWRYTRPAVTETPDASRPPEVPQ